MQILGNIFNAVIFACYGNRFISMGNHLLAVRWKNQSRCTQIVTHIGQKRFSKIAGLSGRPAILF